jgi:hypothetical protein
MADGIDGKGIGLAVKDIVVGIAAAAVGAAGGGQAGASGVLKAGDGIDKIINLAGGGDSRAQRFDRADYAAKPQPQSTPQQPPEPAAPPVPNDRDQALVHLGTVGWTPEQANKILAGPQKYRMTQIAPPQVAGQRVELAQGNAVDLEKGAPVALTSGEAVKTKDATAVSLVEGRRVANKETA